MKVFSLAMKAAIGIAAIALGAEKIGSAVCDVKEDIQEKRNAKNQEQEETEE